MGGVCNNSVVFFYDDIILLWNYLKKKNLKVFGLIGINK